MTPEIRDIFKWMKLKKAPNTPAAQLCEGLPTQQEKKTEIENIFTVKSISKRVDDLISKHGSDFRLFDQSLLYNGAPVMAEMFRCVVNGYEVAYVLYHYLKNGGSINEELGVKSTGVIGFDIEKKEIIRVELTEFRKGNDMSTTRFRFGISDGLFSGSPKDISVDRQKEIADVLGIKYK